MAEDLAGGAPAPADTPAIIETPAAAPSPPAAEPTPRNAIDRAFDAVEKGETTTERTAPKPDKAPVAAPVVAEGERERNPDGTFKAREAAPVAPQGQQPVVKAPAPEARPTAGPLSEAPSRFSPDAKAAWASVPDSVKGEVQRALRETEQGVEKYREAATAYDSTFRPFDEMAKRSNLDSAKTLANYVNIDMLLAKDFDAGITQIFKNKGQDARAWAAKVMGAPAPATAPQDQTIAELREQITQLQRGFQGVHQTIEQQRAGQIGQSLEGFIQALPETDRGLFTELDNEIAAHLQADPSITLADAFAKAKAEDAERYTRRYGAQTLAATVPPAPATAQTRTLASPPQTRAGELSISGAPGAGSNPSTRKTPSSPRAAIDSAFADLGIG